MLTLLHKTAALAELLWHCKVCVLKNHPSPYILSEIFGFYFNPLLLEKS